MRALATIPFATQQHPRHSGNRTAGVSPVLGAHNRRDAGGTVPRGFTVLEMLIACFIALFIFAVGFVTITGTIAARAEAETRIRSTESARLFFQTLERDLAAAHAAQNITTQAGVVPTAPPGTPYTLNLGTRYGDGAPVAIVIDTDFIQFYTRADLPGVRDGTAAVRYFVNNHQQLCREVLLPDPLQPATPALADPNTLSAAELQATSSAMFDRVRSLQVTFLRWDDGNKEFIPRRATDPPIDPNDATHLRVNLFLFHAGGRVTVVDGGSTKVMEHQLPENTNSADGIFVYSKVMPLPAGFKR